MENLKKMEQQATSEWMIKQQREINETLKRHDKELKSVEQEVNDMYEHWVERHNLQV